MNNLKQLSHHLCGIAIASAVLLATLSIFGRSAEIEPPASSPEATAAVSGEPVLRPPAAATADAIQCRGVAHDLGDLIREIATDLSAREILYDSEPLSDCSGILHRVLRAFEARCPGYPLPQERSSRDSRDLARWFHEQGRLIAVSDPLSQADRIRPGSVMFYGRSGFRSARFDLDDLDGALGQIEHVGIVVSVESDDKGKVEGYRLFHGRSLGKVAGVTDYHKTEPLEEGLPPLGNWDQPWLGWAVLGG